MTSTARSDMRLASSWMVIVSGSTISRAIFSFCSCIAHALEALGAAAERGDRTRALLLGRGGGGDREAAAIALFGAARRARRRQHDLLRQHRRRDGRPLDDARRLFHAGPGRNGRSARAMARRGRLGAAAVAACAARRTRAAAGPARRPSRRRASSSDWRLKLASWARRGSSSRLRASAASRSAVRAPRARGALSASASWRRRSSSSRARASSNARARASRCSSVRGGQDDAGLRRRRRLGRAGPRRRRGASDDRRPWTAAAAPRWRRRRSAEPRPGPATRRLTFSTTTALLRPCEKLCRTVPCSTGRFRCKVAFGGAAPHGLVAAIVRFAHAFSKIGWPFGQIVCSRVRRRRPRPESPPPVFASRPPGRAILAQARDPREEGRAGRAAI